MAHSEETSVESTHKVWQAPDFICYVRSINFEPPEHWQEKYKGSKDACDKFVTNCANGCANCNHDEPNPKAVKKKKAGEKEESGEKKTAAKKEAEGEQTTAKPAEQPN